MCIPIGQLKGMLVYSTTIAIITGCFAILSGIIIEYATAKSGFFEQTGHYMKAQLVNSLYGSGGILAALGILGVLGSKHKNIYLLSIYNLGQVVGLIVFIIIAGLGYVLAEQFNQQSLTDCLEQSWSTEINAVTVSSQSNLCKIGCPCSITDRTAWTPDYFAIAGMTDTYGTSTQFQQCTEYTTIESDEAQILAESEKKFECAGWCYPSGYFLFTDVNRGPPDTIGGCYIQVTLWMAYYGNVLGFVATIVSLSLLINLILSCCLCLHPDRVPPPDPDFRSQLYTRLSGYYPD